jgi:hypothetical protein
MSYHVSKNRVAGSLDEVTLDELLATCRKHLITGTVSIEAGGMEGVIVLRAGMPHDSHLGDLVGKTALEAMRALRGGTYEVGQKLPDLDGSLGGAAECRGELGEISMARIMRLCEDQALSCTITIVNDFDRAEVVYRAGEIVGVFLNGKPDEDAIVDIARYENGRFRITSPPLPHDIAGWPSVSREPTAPFTIDHLSARPRAQSAGGSSPGLPGIEATPPEPQATVVATPTARSKPHRIARGTGQQTSIAARGESPAAGARAEPPPVPVAATRPGPGEASKPAVRKAAPLRRRPTTEVPERRGGGELALALIVVLMVASFAAVIWIAAAF